MNPILFISTYKRPGIAQRSLQSLSESQLPTNLQVQIFDDAIEQGLYAIAIEDGWKYVQTRNHLGLPDAKLKPIADAILNAEYPLPYFFVSDDDFIYSRNWAQALIAIYERAIKDGYRPAVVSAFRRGHCGKPNKGRRTPYIEGRCDIEYIDKSESYSLSDYARGVMLVDTEFYRQNPFTGATWDWDMNEAALQKGWHLVVTRHSLVEHIGDMGTHCRPGFSDKAWRFIGENADALGLNVTQDFLLKEKGKPEPILAPSVSATPIPEFSKLTMAGLQ